MRQGISPGSGYAPAALGWTLGMTPGMALEDVWI